MFFWFWTTFSFSWGEGCVTSGTWDACDTEPIEEELAVLWTRFIFMGLVAWEAWEAEPRDEELAVLRARVPFVGFWAWETCDTEPTDEELAALRPRVALGFVIWDARVTFVALVDSCSCVTRGVIFCVCAGFWVFNFLNWLRRK